jgi:hypothetical protein
MKVETILLAVLIAVCTAATSRVWAQPQSTRDDGARFIGLDNKADADLMMDVFRLQASGKQEVSAISPEARSPQPEAYLGSWRRRAMPPRPRPSMTMPPKSGVASMRPVRVAVIATAVKLNPAAMNASHTASFCVEFAAMCRRAYHSANQEHVVLLDV